MTKPSEFIVTVVSYPVTLSRFLVHLRLSVADQAFFFFNFIFSRRFFPFCFFKLSFFIFDFLLFRYYFRTNLFNFLNNIDIYPFEAVIIFGRDKIRNTYQSLLIDMIQAIDSAFIDIRYDFTIDLHRHIIRIVFRDYTAFFLLNTLKVLIYSNITVYLFRDIIIYIFQRCQQMLLYCISVVYITGLNEIIKRFLFSWYLFLKLFKNISYLLVSFFPIIVVSERITNLLLSSKIAADEFKNMLKRLNCRAADDVKIFATVYDICKALFKISEI